VERPKSIEAEASFLEAHRPNECATTRDPLDILIELEDAVRTHLAACGTVSPTRQQIANQVTDWLLEIDP
jgi:hypothetical protein